MAEYICPDYYQGKAEWYIRKAVELKEAEHK